MILSGSYFNGLAPRDGRPLYPGLWRGALRAWCPSLGPTGAVIRDNGPRKDNVAFSGAVSSWSVLRGRHTIDYAGTAAQSFTSTDLLTPKVSVSLWVNRNGSQGGFAFPIGVSDSGSNGWRIYGSVGSFNFVYNVFSDAATTVGFSTIADRTWTHFCATYDGATLNAYTNGILTASKATTTAITYTSATGAMWNKAGWGAWNGALDDIRIYDRALRANEISLLASRPRIAYELSPRRRASSAVAFNRRRRLLVGAHS